MRTIGLARFHEAAAAGRVNNVVVVMRGAREWLFTFEVRDPQSGSPQTFALHTLRGSRLRTWADPRKLFTLLSGHGMATGAFRLEKETALEEHDQPAPGRP